jgi:glycosyltransferase involved in cell wall biosynthesis
MHNGSPWPRISIVTPSYNQAAFIEETIRSVLLQGYPNLEYIVIDAGSTDGTIEIIKKYARWLEYWVSEPDKGQSDAINKGMRMATGNILAWLNSDDGLLPAALTTVAGFLSRRPMSICVGATVEKHEEQTTIVYKTPSFDEMLYHGRRVPQPSTFWTADLWSIAGPLREDLHYVMDYDLWLRMFSIASGIRFHAAPLSYMHYHPGQKTQPANLARIRLENFLSVIGNLPFLQLGAWTFVRKKWLYNTRTRRGIRRFLPRSNDIAFLAYPYHRRLGLKLASRT